MDPKPRIPVARPALVGRELEYVRDCLESGWISSNGTYVERFERAFAEFCGVRHAVACCNGTAALHLALLALGVAPGDEVIVPTLTFVATANAVTYCGARPVFVDSEPATWNLDPEHVGRKISPRTKAIVAVHLYGHPADMDPLRALADRHGLAVVEDAAEAHGAEYHGRRVGSLGQVACFSFYGNKILTTGEGGMLLTEHRELADRARLLRGQGQDPARHYWFPALGFNYRMTNVAAAIGVAQLERADWHLERRRQIALRYRELLGAAPHLCLSPELPWAKNAFWMSCAVLAVGSPIARDELARRLASRGIETRPFFHPMHTLPVYRAPAAAERFPVAERLAAQGLNLPSFATLSDHEIQTVAAALLELLS